MFRASILLDESRKVDATSVQAVTDSVTNAGNDLEFVKLDAKAFGSANAISIDYAVMEKTSLAAVIPVACGWSDVGSWLAVLATVRKGRAWKRSTWCCCVRGCP
jgi:mannose-1-phosphate guanylyltransferase/mannose-6-phosphate isomerase